MNGKYANEMLLNRHSPFSPDIIRTNADSGFGTGKGSSSSNSQNRIMSSDAALFTTRNNTKVIAQRGGLAVLPCAVKWNPTATVCLTMFMHSFLNVLVCDVCVCVCRKIIKKVASLHTFLSFPMLAAQRSNRSEALYFDSFVAT